MMEQNNTKVKIMASKATTDMVLKKESISGNQTRVAYMVLQLSTNQVIVNDMAKCAY
jgi:hypothetical protein